MVSSAIASTCSATSSIESKRAFRRMPSMALKRPVETSQARGFAGTSRGPLLERRTGRIVQRLFGEVEVAEQPDERSKDTADSVR